MEASQNRNLKTGLFVLIGIILFAVSVLLAGGDRAFFTDYYQLKTRLSQVQGLAPGSVVSLAGINVGNVSELRFIPESSQIEVTMNISADFKSRITAGSSVSVKTQGALGDKYVYIQPGSLDAPPLNNGEFLAAEKQTDLLDLISSEGPEKIENISETISEVKALFSNLNQDDNSKKLMSNLVKATEKLDKVLTSTEKLISKIDQGQGTLGALINDPSLHNKVMKILGENPRNTYLKPLIRATIKTNDESKTP